MFVKFWLLCNRFNLTPRLWKQGGVKEIEKYINFFKS